MESRGASLIIFYITVVYLGPLSIVRPRAATGPILGFFIGYLKTSTSIFSTGCSKIIKFLGGSATFSSVLPRRTVKKKTTEIAI